MVFAETVAIFTFRPDSHAQLLIMIALDSICSPAAVMLIAIRKASGSSASVRDVADKNHLPTLSAVTVDHRSRRRRPIQPIAKFGEKGVELVQRSRARRR